MKIKFDEPSTWRGLVWMVGGVAAGIVTVWKGVELGAEILAITGTVVGGLGVLTSDKRVC